jgi:hypothetical protein
MAGYHYRMKEKAVNGFGNGLDIKAEVRRLRIAGKRATSSKKAAIRFLASTGMYTASGNLKPQFR